MGGLGSGGWGRGVRVGEVGDGGLGSSCWGRKVWDRGGWVWGSEDLGLGSGVLRSGSWGRGVGYEELRLGGLGSGRVGKVGGVGVGGVGVGKVVVLTSNRHVPKGKRVSYLRQMSTLNQMGTLETMSIGAGGHWGKWAIGANGH